MTNADKWARLDGLQAGRAIAALMVVAFHANVFILPDRLYDGATSSRVFNMGYAGVEFFFVLSGFIIYFAHAKDFSQPRRATEFLRRRIIRIYPIYWVIFGTLLVLYFLMPGRGPEQARDAQAILTSLFLFPSSDLPIMRVAWTLQHEMLFYLMFLLSLLNLRLGAAAIGLWALGSIVVSLMGDGAYPWDFLFSAYNVLFLFGIWAAITFRRLSVGTARVLTAIGLLLFLLTGLSEAFDLIEWNKAVRTWSYGVGAAMATAALAAGAISSPRWLTFLGDASYSIYLAHLPAMSFFVIVLAKLGAPWGLSPHLSLILMIAWGAAVGSCMYVLVERPLLKRLYNAGKPFATSSERRT